MFKKQKALDIILVGTGNLASQLAPTIENAGHHIRYVYGRNQKHVSDLLSRLYQAKPLDSLDFGLLKVDVVILAISDKAIEAIAKDIVMPEGAVLLHTAGNVSMDSLEYAANDFYGVLYPVQTFSKNKNIDLSHIPFCVEGNNAYSQNLIKELAESISDNVQLMTSRQRSQLHLAAVFACNFSNELIRISYDLLESQNLKASLLDGLIAETINKALELGPKNAQTGPASRGDFPTLDKHMDMLDRFPKYQEIYQLLSQQLLNVHYNNLNDDSE